MGLSPVVDALHVKIVYYHVGKPTGDAEVLFANEADARKAMTKDKQIYSIAILNCLMLAPLDLQAKV